MSGFKCRTTSFIGAIVSVALILPSVPVARSQTVTTQIDQPNRVSVTYVAPRSVDFQKLYDLLKDRRALEKIQEILSPFRLPEELTVKLTECGAVNAFYRRESSKPTVTICYELLKRISESLPKQTTPAGVSPADAEVGQFLWAVLHEVGHAIADIFDLPIFGHEEDAADNFATYIMLQFGKEPARRLIGGAALGPGGRTWEITKRESRSAEADSRLCRMNMVLPEERFYNLFVPGLRCGPDAYFTGFGGLFATNTVVEQLLTRVQNAGSCVLHGSGNLQPAYRLQEDCEAGVGYKLASEP